MSPNIASPNGFSKVSRNKKQYVVFRNKEGTKGITLDKRDTRSLVFKALREGNKVSYTIIYDVLYVNLVGGRVPK